MSNSDGGDDFFLTPRTNLPFRHFAQQAGGNQRLLPAAEVSLGRGVQSSIDLGTRSATLLPQFPENAFFGPSLAYRPQARFLQGRSPAAEHGDPRLNQRLVMPPDFSRRHVELIPVLDPLNDAGDIPSPQGLYLHSRRA